MCPLLTEFLIQQSLLTRCQTFTRFSQNLEVHGPWTILKNIFQFFCLILKFVVICSINIKYLLSRKTIRWSTGLALWDLLAVIFIVPVRPLDDPVPDTRLRFIAKGNKYCNFFSDISSLLPVKIFSLSDCIFLFFFSNTTQTNIFQVFWLSCFWYRYVLFCIIYIIESIKKLFRFVWFFNSWRSHKTGYYNSENMNKIK